MKIIIRHIINTAIALIAFIGVSLVSSGNTVYAGEGPGIMDADEAALFELINNARRDPLGMAEAIGMDREEILTSLPELNDILVNGLPELAFDHRLYQTAAEHTLEMLEKNYYAYDSADGKSPDQRMIEAGYVASDAGEALGLIFFSNFINPNQAVFQIFENIFKDELSPKWVGARNILNPDFNDLGVGIGGGLYQINETSGNVYLATCDFGSSAETYELELMALINQLRAQPAAVTRFFGVNVASVIELFPGYADFFSNGLPPLAFNRQLYAAAEVQVYDMLESGYWGHVSPEGVTPVMRIREQGYSPIWAAESKSRLSTCSNVISPKNTVPTIFKNMFFNAFRTQGFRDYSMLSEKAAESGFRIVAAESRVLSGICGDNVHLTVGDFGASRASDGPLLTGVIYSDSNENGLYDAGEGIPDVTLTVRTPGVGGVVKTITTNSVGGYTGFLSAGQYRISLGAEEDEQIRWIVVETANHWETFEIDGTHPVLE